MADNTEKAKTRPIKVPVYVSALIERDSDDLWGITQETMINEAKNLISIYNQNGIEQVTSDRRAKTTVIGIQNVESIDIQFGNDKCLLLRVTAYKTNLLDGYYQRAVNGELHRFEEHDKLCSDTYFFILYPLISQNAINNKLDIYWHIFIYEDPSKTNDEMVRIARLIMSNIIKVPIKNIKSDKMLADIRKYRLISEVEITLSAFNDADENDTPSYLQNYSFESTLKREKKIKVSNMQVDDAISAFEDTSFTANYSKRQLKFTTHNKRVFSMIQEFKDKLHATLEDSFNYSIDVDEAEIKSGAIFTVDKIIQNVAGIFTRYMAICADE